MRVIKVGFDLDGVIIDKPPIITKGLLEWFVRSHQNKRLAYRYPISRLEKLIRWLSHHPCLRPPLKENLAFIKKLAKKENYQLYLISGRYSFLEKRTKQWLKKHGLDQLFQGIFINLKNGQPHLFKEKKLRELKINFFIDDDLDLAKYLAKSCSCSKIFCFNKRRNKNYHGVSLVDTFEKVFQK